VAEDGTALALLPLLDENLRNTLLLLPLAVSAPQQRCASTAAR
jgi:hypothetical protein